MLKRKPVEGTATLQLTVGVMNAKGKLVETTYNVRFLESHPEIGRPAWRLIKVTDRSFYDVILTATGAECSCPDFVFARDHKDEKGCKHVAALRVVGLLRAES